MKRLISLALCLVLMLSLAACGSNKIMRSEYILNFDTGNSYAFTSKYPDFHVFRGDIKLKSKYGDVSITLCYYNDLGFNITYSLKTTTAQADEIEAMANDENHSLYAKVTLGKKELPIGSYAYSIREKRAPYPYPNPNGGPVTFDLNSSYSYTKRVKADKIHFEFLDVSTDIPLSTVKGEPIDSERGQEYLEQMTSPYMSTLPWK